MIDQCAGVLYIRDAILIEIITLSLTTTIEIHIERHFIKYRDFISRKISLCRPGDVSGKFYKYEWRYPISKNTIFLFLRRIITRIMPFSSERAKKAMFQFIQRDIFTLGDEFTNLGMGMSFFVERKESNFFFSRNFIKIG